ncbi:hypothetical protein PIROE2DRAFT_62571 [Piromyces sp. E2]|nr:hypothetical protein PIROE2DRAFT_62571 [Piromyces sp. E2]|eukprot:OUM61342.1 hypothetical protein PIROE2DRAFT_62571 [Piromyces sp. E2]
MEHNNAETTNPEHDKLDIEMDIEQEKNESNVGEPVVEEDKRKNSINKEVNINQDKEEQIKVSPITEKSKTKKTTEKLEHLDLSIINDKNIKNAKKEVRLERLKSIREDDQTSMDQDVQNKIRRIEKHVRLMDGFETFNMEDHINNLASMEVTTKLKLKLTQGPVNNAITNVITAISNHKIVKVKGKVQETDTEIFLDSCASMNMVTKSLLGKLKDIREPIGSITDTIFQAHSIANKTTDIYRLKLKIGTYEFEDNFRLIEDNKLFDILVGIETLKKNRFNLNFVKDKLYYIDHENNEV